jgi:NAD/NADP transhydrogenase alpha subunit
MRTAQNVPHDDDRGRHRCARQGFRLGAGVAGLQAIATARRLGAVVSAYDVRPVVKEQVESVGGKFIISTWIPRRRKTKAAMPKPWTKLFTGASVNCLPK